jgi:hypothetical protein
MNVADGGWGEIPGHVERGFLPISRHCSSAGPPRSKSHGKFLRLPGRSRILTDRPLRPDLTRGDINLWSADIILE